MRGALTARLGARGRAGRREPAVPVRGRMPSVLDALDALIREERFTKDARLPPERELAVTLGVSRKVLRRGLERLEAAGRIWRHRGKGTFVGSRPMPEPAGMIWAGDATDPTEVMEARLELEPILAALAAVRATPPQAQQIEWCLARSKSATDLATFELWDGRLHRAIAEAAHNSILLTLYDVVNVARGRAFWGQLQDAAIRRCGLEAIWAQHHAFVEPILQRDPIEARRSMRAHIETVRSSMFAPTDEAFATRPSPHASAPPPEPKTRGGRPGR